MDVDIQWFWLGRDKVCMSAMVCGNLLPSDFKEMLGRVGEAFVSATGPALVDLRQAQWDLASEDFYGVVAAFAKTGLGIDHKVALVCGRDIDHFGQLIYIASGMSNRGFK